jgi:hypothetical protein
LAKDPAAPPKSSFIALRRPSSGEDVGDSVGFTAKWMDQPGETLMKVL